MLKGATVLITGGTGSFGQTMARHLAGQDCKELRIFSRDEAKQDPMRVDFGSDHLAFHIGDACDANAVARVMRGVDYVFQAALKQVPSCELFPFPRTGG